VWELKLTKKFVHNSEGEDPNWAPIERLQKVKQALITLARKDPLAFSSYVLKDEATGRAVKPSPAHIAWHEIAGRYDRLVLWAHVEAGKTQQMALSRTMWELGRNPNLRVCVVSNTAGQASKIVRAISHYITASRELKEVFPHLRRSSDKKAPWTGNSITVERETKAKDASVVGIGVHGAVLGARLDLLIFDDVLDYENTRTAYMREELRRWVYATLFGRLVEGARVIVIGTPFHPDDLLHHLEKQPAWTGFRFPVMTGDGKPTWPERWSKERIESKRAEIGPLEFARQMMCQARADDDARFRRSWMDACLARGEGRYMVDAYDPPPGTRTFTGVDLAIGRGQKSDLTALVTVAMHQNGDIEILNVQSGKWTAQDIMGRCVSAHYKFRSDVIVESNQAQDFLIQIIAKENPEIPIRPFVTTGKKKRDPFFGLEAMGADLAAAKFIIPSGKQRREIHGEIAAWIEEMLYYDPLSHAGDRLMASWIAWEACKRSITTQGATLVTIGKDEPAGYLGGSVDEPGVQEIWDWIDTLG